MKKRRKLRWARAPNPYRRAASVIAHKLRTMELRCSAFLFDLDGVLVDSRAVVERVCRTWALRHGLDPEKVMRIAHGRRARDTVEAVAPHLDIASTVWSGSTPQSSGMSTDSRKCPAFADFWPRWMPAPGPLSRLVVRISPHCDSTPSAYRSRTSW